MKKEFDFITKDMEFESKKINDICKIEYGKRITKAKNSVKQTEQFQYPVYGGGDISFYTNTFNRPIEGETDTLVMSRFGVSNNCIRFVKENFFLLDSGMSIHTNLNKKYIVYLLKILQDIIFFNADGPGQKNMKIEKMLNIDIPIPSIQNQQIIVNYLDEKMEYHKTYWNTMSQMFSNDSFSTSDDSNIVEESDDLEDDEITVV